jgi:hypothetical protein
MRFAAPTESQQGVDPLDRAAAVMSAASTEALRLVASYNEAKRWERDGATSMTSWLAARMAWGGGRPGNGSGWPMPCGTFLRSPGLTPGGRSPGTSSSR